VSIATAPTVVQRARSVPERIRAWEPRTDLGLSIRRALPHLPADLAYELLDRISRSLVVESALRLRVIRREGAAEDHGVVSRRLVTDAFVAALVDAFQNSVELETFKFHAIGTGSTAESAGDTALVTELTTEYTGNVRATGTTTEFAANVYQTVATNTLDGTPGAALREHGVLTQAATGGGTLLDRSVYGAITLSSGDGLASDYRLTASSGG